MDAKRAHCSSRPLVPRFVGPSEKGCWFRWEDACLVYEVRLLPLKDHSVPVAWHVEERHLEEGEVHVLGDLAENVSEVSKREHARRAVEMIQEALSRNDDLDPFRVIFLAAGFTLQNARLPKLPRGPNPPTDPLVPAAALLLFDGGWSRKTIAGTFGYSDATVKAWLTAARDKEIARGDTSRARALIGQDGRKPEEVLAAWGARSL